MPLCLESLCVHTAGRGVSTDAATETLQYKYNPNYQSMARAFRQRGEVEMGFR
jgi:hypothetical protein